MANSDEVPAYRALYDAYMTAADYDTRRNTENLQRGVGREADAQLDMFGFENPMRNHIRETKLAGVFAPEAANKPKTVPQTLPGRVLSPDRSVQEYQLKRFQQAQHAAAQDGLVVQAGDYVPAGEALRHMM